VHTFNDIKELLDTLKREEALLSEMFSKRKAFNYKMSDALEIVDNDERIDALLRLSVIQKSDNFLELDDLFLDFFEQVLDVNEDINLSYVNENIKSIKENIAYYLKEDNEDRKYSYLGVIKRTFRKIGVITRKNVVDLRRNIENTFKNESNYKIKQLKLETMDKKRSIVRDLIDKTLFLTDDEPTFFNRARNGELKQIIKNLKYSLNECFHNLIEIESQIINYLNKIEHQSEFLEKLRKLKYLKEQFRIESETDIKSILLLKNQLIFEVRIVESLNLSINFLKSDEFDPSIVEKVAKNNLIKLNFKPLVADIISDEFLENNTEKEIIINLEKVRNQFVATSDNLFNFILNYDFLKKVDFNERVTIFCQMASQFELELKFENEYQINNNIEYALIYPK
jgi:hypothetical protein